MNLVVKDFCEECDQFDPEVVDLYADNQKYNRVVRCKDYSKCIRVSEITRQQIHDSIIQMIKENTDAWKPDPVPMWRIIADVEDITGVYKEEYE